MVAAPIDSTIMKAQLPSVVVIWFALMATLSNHPIMMPVPTKAEASRNICSEMGTPMRSSPPMLSFVKCDRRKPSR